jgi:hypothetical protein
LRNIHLLLRNKRHKRTNVFQDAIVKLARTTHIPEEEKAVLGNNSYLGYLSPR